MPTNRKRMPRGKHLDDTFLPAMLIHIEIGDCCLAGTGKGCGCGLRDVDGKERTELANQIKARMSDAESMV